MQHTNTSSKRSRSTIGLFYRDLGARRGALKGTRTGRTSRDFSQPARCRTDRILFRFLCDLPTADAEKIRSERLGEKPVTTVAALGQGNARCGSVAQPALTTKSPSPSRRRNSAVCDRRPLDRSRELAGAGIVACELSNHPSTRRRRRTTRLWIEGGPGCRSVVH